MRLAAASYNVHGPRRAHAALVLFALLLSLLVIMFTHAFIASHTERPGRDKMFAMTQRLGLTDLCLFTEARYTRHPAMADLHSAFQDHPGAMEHFPSGSLLAPPAHIGQGVWAR